MSIGFCARDILFQLCALSIVISRTVLNGNVFELNFAFDNDDDDGLFARKISRPRLYRFDVVVFIVRGMRVVAFLKLTRAQQRSVCFISNSKVN